MKLKNFNIIYGGILIAMLIAELTSADVVHLYIIRFLQLFILINIVGQGFKFLNKAIYFILPTAIYLFYSIFNFSLDEVLGGIFNILWWFAFMSIINFSLSNNEDFKLFKDILFKSTFFLTTITGIFGLYKLFQLSRGIFLPYMEVPMPDGTSKTLLGTSLNVDYNVYSIGLFCGLFAGIYCYKNTTKLKFKLLYATAIIVILSSGMLSSSRRGLVIGGLLILFLFIWSFKSSSFKAVKELKDKIPKYVSAPWIVIIIAVLFGFFIIRADPSKILESSAEISSLVDRLETVNSLTSEENNTRGNRWEYAFKYYADLPIYSQLFGNGFSYLNSFGKEFGEGEVDHPHNVWIASLLYGGIVGFILTIWLTVYALYIYIKKREIYGEIIYWYILFLILNFTSSNSIYSSRFFVVLLLFPFLNFVYTHINHNTEMLELEN